MLTINRPNVTAVHNGTAGAFFSRYSWNGSPCLSVLRFVGTPLNLTELEDRAASKLGLKRDRRCRNGWRSI